MEEEGEAQRVKNHAREGQVWQAPRQTPLRLPGAPDRRKGLDQRQSPDGLALSLFSITNTETCQGLVSVVK